MLTIARERGQGVYIDMDIYVRVSDVIIAGNGKVVVKLAVDAPPDVAVTRSELGRILHERAQDARDKGEIPTREDLGMNKRVP